MWLGSKIGEKHDGATAMDVAFGGRLTDRAACAFFAGRRKERKKCVRVHFALFALVSRGLGGQRNHASRVKKN